MIRPELEPQRSGQMTAVMRAVSVPNGQKVLRIAVVQAGKVIEERLMKAREVVTVGTAERDTFLVGGSKSSLVLFEPGKKGYVLQVTEGMSGRISMGGEVKPLVSWLEKTSGPRSRLVLGEDARGRVVVGETTFLFELVAPPPVKARPQLPMAVRSGLAIDWTTTFVAALSFLFHFGIVGSIYSDWMDPVVDDQIHVAQLIDAVKQLPAPPVVEDPKEQVDVGATAAVATSTPTPSPARTTASTSTDRRNKPQGGATMSDQKASQIASELQQLDVGMLVALNGRGTSTDQVIGNSDLPLSMLDEAAASNAKAGNQNGDGLHLGDSSGHIGRPGENVQGLQALANVGRGDRPANGGVLAPPPGPKAGVSVGGANPRGGHVANAEAVVAQMAAGFRRCYNKGLLENASMQGSVRILTKIGPNGDVLSASPSGTSGNLSGTVISCVVSRVSSSHFDAPADGGATLDIPVGFKLQ